jgi:hypothetical protein
MTAPKEVRDRLVRALRRDLVGPGDRDTDLATELLETPPSRWYLTGYLAPEDEASAPVEDADANDDMEGADTGGDLDGAVEPATLDGQADGTPAKAKYLPSSLGLSFLLEPEVREIDVVVTWGDYLPEPPIENEGLFAKTPDVEGDSGAEAARKVSWRRLPRRETVTVPVVKSGRSAPILVPGSGSPVRKVKGALELVAHTKLTSLPTPDGERQVRSVALFLVNRRPGSNHHFRDVTYVFQAGLKVRCGSPIVARTDLSGYNSDDPDLRIADLHYADTCEYAVGRNTSAGWMHDADGQVRAVWTEPLPTGEVERVAANLDIHDVAFGMEDLAEAARDPAHLNAALRALPAAYAAWIDGQRPERFGITARRRGETADMLRNAMAAANARIAAAIETLGRSEPCRKAFGLMNRAMANAARRRVAVERGVAHASLDQPIWRPFQLAFILLNLDGLAEPTHDDRKLVDLLFFPTGGGKTEAYLGIAAFTIAHRRISRLGVLGAGVTVIMRYTLRLLTLDQLGRAAGLICALELLREDPANGLGDWPIEIGLWVGSAASPNRLNDGSDRSAAARLRRYRGGKQSPVPLKACPWCGRGFERESFRLWPSAKSPQRLLMKCANPACDFAGDRDLPILVTDEEIYRRLPAFIIATVDKFAALPWEGEVGGFFGHVQRADGQGFYGPATAGGAKLPAPLPPPDLIIQDELHLITGPLGTVAGLYECAIDRLATRIDEQGRCIRPKIVASTATARRAANQIQALFDRADTAVFPPPGLDRRDSFFAQTKRADEDNPPRLYLGIAAIGKGQKLVFLRALRTLMGSAQKAYVDDGRDAADPYLTALCYFNALRELGSARRIVEDDVRKDIAGYGSNRVRLDPTGPEFIDRSLPDTDPIELTSRVSTDMVAEAKRSLEKSFPIVPTASPPGVCNVAMATNMISVGLDIVRLGLMVVNGQPKTASEYIQATSRVGRDHLRPGLVVTLLNPHKPRDRAHYESFRHFHEAFYRAVEGASVTPWAPRALDRALPALTVALARHLEQRLSGENAAGAIDDFPEVDHEVVEAILRRASDAEADDLPAIERRVEDLLAAWRRIAAESEANAIKLGYTMRAGANRKLLREVLDPNLGRLSEDEKRFPAPRSMRGVEASVALRIQGPYKEWMD